jgi:Uma2 family endonuclease
MMPPVATRVPPGPPRNLLWTVDQFHYLGDLGVFEGRRAMLIDGVIVEEGPMNPPHAVALELSEDAIRAAFGPGWRVRVQMPLVLGQSTDPEPDIAVVAGSARGSTAHPTTAALVIEVSDTSLGYDTTLKRDSYAAGGIADYWVLDVNARQALIFRDPQPDPNAPRGARYVTHFVRSKTDTISPLAVPVTSIRVVDMLP